MVENQCMIRAFERTEITLKMDASEDETKMHFLSQEVGIPEGLEM